MREVNCCGSAAVVVAVSGNDGGNLDFDFDCFLLLLLLLLLCFEVEEGMVESEVFYSGV
jgi:hypothetical protein